MRRLLVIFALSNIITAAAKADWQYTKWEMTIEEVIEASQGTATKTNEKIGSTVGNRTQLVAPYSDGTNNFHAYFAFDETENLLGSITLNPIDDIPAVDLLNQLVSHHGEPSEVKDNPLIKTIIWVGPNETITLLYIPNSLTNIIYRSN